MKSHELALILLEQKDCDLNASVKMNSRDENIGNKVACSELIGFLLENDGSITLLFNNLLGRLTL